MLRLLTIGPIIASLPLVTVYHLGTYLYYRPKRGLARHLGVNVFRWLGAVVRGNIVAAPDPEADKIPKLAKYHAHLADAGEPRMIPPVADDVPLSTTLAVADVKVNNVHPASIPAFMLAPKGTPTEDIWAKAKRGEKGIFYLIGGGYEVGHPLQFFCMWDLVREAGLRSFTPNYRKTVITDQAWPAPLLDILAGWQYMVEELGFEPHNIVITGSSAGAHASLALLRCLDELQEKGFTRWGLPAGVYASAPVGDSSCSQPSIDTHAHTDWLTDPRSIIFPCLLRNITTPAADPYLSPAFATDGHFKRIAAAGTAIYVDAGTDERLWDEVVLLVETMRHGGIDVKFTPYEGGTHCEYVFARSPVKFWPGVGFTWPLLVAQFKLFINDAWKQEL